MRLYVFFIWINNNLNTIIFYTDCLQLEIVTIGLMFTSKIKNDFGISLKWHNKLMAIGIESPEKIEEFNGWSVFEPFSDK